MWRIASGAEWMWRMSERSRVDVENEQAEWMWTIPEYLERISFYFRLQFFSLKYTLSYVFLFVLMIT